MSTDPTVKGKPCQCLFDGGIQIKECDFHTRQSKLIKLRVASFLETRIKKIFNETYLYKVKDALLEEIKRIKQ